jgi:hypothetical protein
MIQDFQCPDHPRQSPQTVREGFIALIQTVDPEKAEGQVKEVFEVLRKTIGMVPAPMQWASAIPGMLNLSRQALQAEESFTAYLKQLINCALSCNTFTHRRLTYQVN